MLTVALVLLAGTVAVLVAIVTVGQWKWNAQTRHLLARLEAGRSAAHPTRHDPHACDGLPAVVQRYFRAALPDGAAMVVSAKVEHRGLFNLGEAVDRWVPFRSRQQVVANPPGFVWDGRVRMALGLNIHVHDAYIAGDGLLQPAILGLFGLGGLRGGGDIARGEMMRFLAEAAWYPTVLLPSQGLVTWQGIDERSASATLTDAGMRVTLRFCFDAQGLIASVYAPARGRLVDGATVMCPWEGRWTDYQVHSGMRIPMSGEVAWLRPASEGGRRPYWRGTITALDYAFAP